MIAGPGDAGSAPGAGGRGRLRAAHADRERVIEVLKAAFVRGWLTKDEFDVRVGQVLASRTYADLTPAIADIAGPGWPRSSRRVPRPGNRLTRYGWQRGVQVQASC